MSIVTTTVTLIGATASQPKVWFSGVQMHKGDVVSGNLKLAGWISYKFQCAACEHDCVLQIPLIHRNLTLPTPKVCRVTAASAKLNYQMWDQSPTNGNVAFHFEGSLTWIQGSTGATLMDDLVKGIVT
jgi:frataxin-like iron-binding protein CyaY